MQWSFHFDSHFCLIYCRYLFRTYPIPIQLFLNTLQHLLILHNLQSVQILPRASSFGLQRSNTFRFVPRKRQASHMLHSHGPRVRQNMAYSSFFEALQLCDFLFLSRPAESIFIDAGEPSRDMDLVAKCFSNYQCYNLPGIQGCYADMDPTIH